VRGRQREYARAAEAAEQSLAIARQIGHPEALWRAAAEASRAHLALNDVPKARTEALEAIATLESLRGQVAGADQDRERYFESRVSPYQQMVSIALRDRKPAEALLYAERAKARVLAEVLERGRVSVTHSMTPQERARERDLTSRLAAASARLAAARSAAPPEPARAAA